MVIVTGLVLARRETFDEILHTSLGHILCSRAETGCFSHAVHHDAEEPLRLCFLER